MRVSKIELISDKLDKKIEVKLDPNTDYLDVLYLREFMEAHNVQLELAEVVHDTKGDK